MSRDASAQGARLPLGEEEPRPTFRRERSALKRGIWPVAGCDEAGRGPLAGPVVAAAVILDPQRVPRGLDDSKKLDRATREKLYAKICACAEVAVAMAPPARIDRDNILRASLWALARAVVALPARPKLVFVDGRDRIECGCDCEAVIRGDAIMVSSATWVTPCRNISRRWRASGLRSITGRALRQCGCALSTRFTMMLGPIS